MLEPALSLINDTMFNSPIGCRKKLTSDEMRRCLSDAKFTRVYLLLKKKKNQKLEGSMLLPKSLFTRKLG